MIKRLIIARKKYNEAKRLFKAKNPKAVLPTFNKSIIRQNIVISERNKKYYKKNRKNIAKNAAARYALKRKAKLSLKNEDELTQTVYEAYSGAGRLFEKTIADLSIKATVFIAFIVIKDNEDNIDTIRSSFTKYSKFRIRYNSILQELYNKNLNQGYLIFNWEVTKKYFVEETTNTLFIDYAFSPSYG